MRARLMKTALVALVAMSGLGATCFSITDPFVVSVNVRDIQNQYNVTTGTVTFDPGCVTKNSADYIDGAFNVSGAGRLVDIIVQTTGPYTGNVVGGQVRIGGSQATLVTLATYAGGFQAFNTPQSLIQNNVTMTLNSAGVNTLLSLIQNQSPVVICHSGAFSSAINAGNSILVTIFAQISATP